MQFTTYILVAFAALLASTESRLSRKRNPSSTSDSSSSSSSSSEDVSSYFGPSAHVEVRLGDDKQLLRMAVDTNSPSTWVTSRKCTSFQCKKHRKYKLDTDSGSTKYQFGKLQFFEHAVSGRYVRDRFSIAGDMKIKDFKFLDANILPEVFGKYKWDGILGLGYPQSYRTSTEKGESFMEEFFATRKNGEEVVSLWYDPDNCSRKKAGKLILGHVDHSLYKGELKYYDVPDDSNGWVLDGEEIQVGEASINKVRYVFDTAAKTISIPSYFAHSISLDDKFEFSFGKKSKDTFSISKNQFNSKSCSRRYKNPIFGHDLPAFKGSDDGKTRQFVFLGEPFFRKYYVVFDGRRSQRRIGIALAN